MKLKQFITTTLVTAMTLAPLGFLAHKQDIQASEKTKVTFWHGWAGDEAKKLAKIIDEFNTSQDEIEVDVLDSQSRDAILTALTGTDGPDLVYNMDYMANQWGHAGLLRPLDDLIESSGIDLKNTVQSELEIVKIDDEHYGIPYTMDVFKLFYNKKILDEFGFEAPKTLEEMLEQSKEIAKLNGDKYERLGYVPDFPWIESTLIAHKFGAELWDPDKKELMFPSEQWTKALEYKNKYYSDFDSKKVLTFKSGFGAYDSPENPFFQGKVAFAIEGEWYPTFIKEYAPKDFEWGSVAIPASETYPEGSKKEEISAGMLMINTKSKVAEAAFKFISWLKEDQHYLDFCIAKGSLPTTYSAMKSDRIEKEAPDLKPFVDVVLEAEPQSGPAVSFFSEMIRQLKAAEEKVYSGELEPNDAYQEAADNLEDSVQEERDR